MTIQELRAVDVTISFGPKPIVSNINLAAQAGKWTTITGPSGSGQSTLLQALCGLLPVQHGAVLVDGKPAWSGLDKQPSPGIVSQDYSLIPLLTAAETVSLPLQATGASRSDIDQRSESCLAALGLAATADRLTSNLSGGQRQRVAIARMLAVDSPLLFLDEPTSELDATNRDLVVALLRRQANQGAVLVVVTNDPTMLDLSDTIHALTPEGTLET